MSPRLPDHELASMALDAEVNDGCDFISPDDGARAVLDLRDARSDIAELKKIERITTNNIIRGWKEQYEAAEAELAALKAATTGTLSEAMIEAGCAALMREEFNADWENFKDRIGAQQKRDKVRAILTAATLARADGWQPIRTAPKDGTRILLAKGAGHPDHPTFWWWMCLGHWSEKWGNWNDGIEPSGLADPNWWAAVSKPCASQAQTEIEPVIQGATPP